MLHHGDRHVRCVKNPGAVRAEEHGQRFRQIERVKQTGRRVIVNVYSGPEIANDENG